MDTAKMYDLPKLGYDYHALAPVISEDLLRLHHAKHHAAYVNGANTILQKDLINLADYPRMLTKYWF